jgi:Fe-S cluster assembly protein SufB
MDSVPNDIREFANPEYKYGFVTELETDTAPRGLNEDIIPARGWKS